MTIKIFLLNFLAFSYSAFVPDQSPHSLGLIVDKVNSIGTTWKAGHNFDPNISKATLKRLCGSKLEDQSFESPTINDDEYGIASSDIPASFDARKQWNNCHFIGHVSDQGNCGSCWAISVTSVLADRYCIATKGKFRFMLSADDLLTCCNECGHGCDGGCPCYIWYHLTRRGIVTGGDHGSSHGCKPYTISPCNHHINGSLPTCDSTPEVETPFCHFKCSNNKHGIGYWNDFHKVKNYYNVNATVEAIQKEILKNGPVQASFNVYEDFFTYKSGVYHHVTGAEVGGHAVKVIGWGEENSTPYWLVVNSWNKSWGDSGVFKIRRGSNECNFERMVFAGTPDLPGDYNNQEE